MTYAPLCDHHVTYPGLACIECARIELRMQLAEADENFSALAEWQARMDAHLAAEHSAEEVRA